MLNTGNDFGDCLLPVIAVAVIIKYKALKLNLYMEDFLLTYLGYAISWFSILTGFGVVEER